MSNGIASIVTSLVVVYVVLLSGCAQDPAIQTGDHVHEHRAMPVEPTQAAVEGDHVIANKLCPVSGEPLGSMGDPVPVTVDGETLFVCCRGCVKKVKADPAKYFAIARRE